MVKNVIQNVIQNFSGERYSKPSKASKMELFSRILSQKALSKIFECTSVAGGKHQRNVPQTKQLREIPLKVHDNYKYNPAGKYLFIVHNKDIVTMSMETKTSGSCFLSR